MHFRFRSLAILPVCRSTAVPILVAAPAQASRVNQSGETFEYDAGGGEANRVSVTFAVSGSGQVTTTLSDSEAISISGSCQYTDGGNRRRSGATHVVTTPPARTWSWATRTTSCGWSSPIPAAAWPCASGTAPATT